MLIIEWDSPFIFSTVERRDLLLGKGETNYGILSLIMIIPFNDFISVYIQKILIVCCYSCLIMPEKTNETVNLFPQVLLSSN